MNSEENTDAAAGCHRHKRGPSRLLMLWVMLSLLAASGASCPRRFQTTGPQAPIAFTQPPALNQLITTINANTERVQRMKAEGATLSISGVPTLKAQLALERPLRLRLIAGLGLTGTELDLGSNDEFFWMWAKRNQPPAVYYARHQDVANGASQNILPIPPSWLIEALGLVQLDPNGAWEGPYQRGQGRLEIRTRVKQPAGEWIKVYVVDDQRGLILEQHVYDGAGQLLATALASAHAFNAANQVTLPRKIDIQLPPAQMSFSLEVDGYTINATDGDSPQLWELPQIEGTPMVPLASHSGAGAPGLGGPLQRPAGTIGFNSAAELHAAVILQS